MKMIRIYNYDDRTEYIREDQIESIVFPSGSPNDNGALVLLGGRRISFGRSSGQAERIAKEIQGVDGL